VGHVFPAPDRVRTVLLELTRHGSALADLPQGLVELCSRSLPVSGVGLALMTNEDRPAGVVAASDGVAVVLEDLQFTLGEGPCVEASRTGRPVLVPDLAGPDPVLNGTRWPVFTAEAVVSGVGAVFAFPLRIGAIRIGALDLYRDRAGALERDDVATALAFADAATSLVLHLQTKQPVVVFPGLHDEGDDPTAGGLAPWAMPLAHDRAVVHQATGMISVTAEVGLAEALVLLRARAYTDQRPVDAVATDVLAGRLHFRPESAGGAE
jgi:hypothetical protein